MARRGGQTGVGVGAILSLAADEWCCMPEFPVRVWGNIFMCVPEWGGVCSCFWPEQPAGVDNYFSIVLEFAYELIGIFIRDYWNRT